MQSRFFKELVAPYDVKNMQEFKKAIRTDTRLNTLEEIQSKMISLHTDMIFRYGVDIIEARADAFGELKDWLKEQIDMYGE